MIIIPLRVIQMSIIPKTNFSSFQKAIAQKNHNNYYQFFLLFKNALNNIIDQNSQNIIYIY